ncbi:MAG: ribonuclease Y, partial [Clostridia bacterium]|nr:ribonuclease Y [Clostridia bacterium]
MYNPLNALLVGTLGVVLISVGVFIVALAAGFFIGYVLYSKIRAKKIGETEAVVAKMIEEAQSESKQIKKEAILEAKEQDLKLRNDFEAEAKEKRAEMQKLEARLNQKDDILSKKEINLIKRNDELEQTKKELDHAKKDLEKKEESLEKQKEVIEKQHEIMVAELEKISQLSQEEAKSRLVETIKDDARKEAAVFVRNQEAAAKEEADKKAKNIISLAVQKCSVEHASEITVSVIPLPSEDMKARIIGREGRNIRALENATGIEIIIDDTPEVVIASGFDPIRREVAKITLERLISDGRIHPARIEETAEKVKKEIDATIKEAGEAAMFEAGLYGIHPELIKLLGRLKYRTSYGQNVLKHSLEVSYLAGVMAAELGCDVNLAKRGGLLHDIGKAVDHEMEGTHIQIGTDLAKKYKESGKVINCIQAHHGDVEPTTIEAVLVQAADAISGARPGARR